MEVSRGVVLHGNAGSVSELNVGVLRCSGFQKVFVTERIGKHKFASLFNELVSGGGAAFVFTDAGLDYGFNALSFASGFERVDEVLVVRRVVVVQGDESGFDSGVTVVRILGRGASGKRKAAGHCRYYGEQNCDNFLHYKNTSVPSRAIITWLVITFPLAVCRIQLLRKVIFPSSILSTIASESRSTPDFLSASPPP